MHFDDPSDAKDARLAIAAFMARTKLDLTDAFGTMEREVEGDPVAFDTRSKKALDQYLTDLPAQLLPEQRQFLRDELEEDRGLMLNGLRTAALERDRVGHNADLARVADRFAADAETEARKLGFSGEVDGGFRALAVHQGLGKVELALSERTDLDDQQKQDFLTQARSRSAEAAVSGAFEAGLADGPDAAQQMIEDFRAMDSPEGIDKDTQEAIATRLNGRLRDARNRLMLETLTAETEAVVERAQTVTELLVGAGEGTAGHAEIQAAALSPKRKSRLAARVEARMAEERKRHDGRTLIARIMAGESAEGDTPILDPSNPDHQAAVDDYFKTVVVPNRGRVKGAAPLIAATGMVPKGVNLILAKALSLPPDLGEEPRSGPSPSEQAIVAGLVARIDAAAPHALDGIDPRIRARAELINNLIDGGGSPEQAALRADALMAQQAAEANAPAPEFDPGFALNCAFDPEVDPGFAIDGAFDPEVDPGFARGRALDPEFDPGFIALDEDEDFDDDGMDVATDANDGELVGDDGDNQLAQAPGPAGAKQKVPANTQSPVPNPKIRDDSKKKPSLGDGRFGTSRDGGTRTHEGVDLEAAPGTAVRSPIDGTIVHVGDPYKPTHPLHGQFNTIHIREANGDLFKLFYVAPTDASGKPLIKPGDRVKVGDPIGTMQDRAAANPGMTNHVHVEVLPPGSKTPVDPAPWLKAWGVK